jgi:hypothetical protein
LVHSPTRKRWCWCQPYVVSTHSLLLIVGAVAH